MVVLRARPENRWVGLDPHTPWLESKRDEIRWAAISLLGRAAGEVGGLESCSYLSTSGNTLCDCRAAWIGKAAMSAWRGVVALR